MTLEARPPRLSTTEMNQIVLPQHANALGNTFGGTVMSWVDICAAIAAQRHCGRIAVTASVDGLEFLAPIRVGDVVRLVAHVNAAFRTSLEVEVLVEVEDAASRVRKPCADALMTFVAVDEAGRPCPVPPVLPETDEERERLAAAAERRNQRLLRKQARTRQVG